MSRPTAVSDLDFAAWLDGRLPEAAAARIEAAVAADPELRRAALDLADVLGKPLPAAPARMAVRAQALVGFEAERQAGRGSGFLGRLFSSGTRYALQRAAMAAMAIVIAGAGFMVGGGLGDSFAQQQVRRGRHRRHRLSETLERIDRPLLGRDLTCRRADAAPARPVAAAQLLRPGGLRLPELDRAADIRSAASRRRRRAPGPARSKSWSTISTLDGGQREALQRPARRLRHDAARALARDPESARADRRRTEAAADRHDARSTG